MLQEPIPKLSEESGLWQGGSSNFLAGARDIAIGKARSEDEKFEGKPTPTETDSTDNFGITE